MTKAGIGQSERVAALKRLVRYGEDRIRPHEDRGVVAIPKWLLLLCAYLLVWVPVNFAALATLSLDSIDARGVSALLELLAHGGAAGSCAAAGWMLWVRHPAGIPFGSAAVAAQAAVTIQALHASALPRDVPPGAALPFTAATILYAAAWILYLGRSRRLRTWIGAA